MKYKNIIRTTILSAALLGASSAYAVMPGFNAGAQLGLGISEYNGHNIDNVDLRPVSVDNKTFAGRVYGGYQFDQFLGAELGYTAFTKTKFNNILGVPGLDGGVRHQAVDLSAKGTYSLNNCVDLYGKLGAGYVWAKSDGTFNNGHANTFMPVMGLGVAYNLTPNVPVELGYTRFQKVNNKISSLNLISVGVAYNFG